MITADEMCKYIYRKVSKAGKAAFISAIVCGYSPVYIENEEKEKLKENLEIQEMLCYPKAGSIKVIDGIVVVKLSESVR